MQSELSPREHLEKLFQRPPAARERDEGVGKVGHDCLPFVHRVDDAKIGHTVVRNLLRDESRRNDTRDLPAGGKNGIRDNAHEPDPRTSIDQAYPARRESMPELVGRVSILRLGAGA
jgi:hypothetical protein